MATVKFPTDMAVITPADADKFMLADADDSNEPRTATVSGLKAYYLDEGNAVITNTTTDAGLTIDQDGDGYGLYVDTEASTASKYGLLVETGQGADSVQLNYSGSYYTSLLKNPTSATAGNYFYRDLASGDTNSPLVVIKQDNAGDDQNTLNIQQDGTGKALYIDNNGTGAGMWLQQDGSLATNQASLYLYLNADITSGEYGQRIYTAVEQTGGTLLDITSGHASSVGTVCKILNAGTGDGLFIDSNNAGAIALNIDAENETAIGMNVQCDALTSAGIAAFKSNSADTTSRTLVEIVNDHADATGTTCFKIQQDSTGLGIDCQGDVAINCTAETNFGLTVANGTSGNNYETLFLKENDTNENEQRIGIHARHYLRAEESVRVIGVTNGSSTNVINIGGGSSVANSATQIGFYTAANYNTTTGTQRMKIDSSGNVNIPGLTASSDVQTDASKNLVSVSDERDKRINGEVEYGLKEILGINPVLFNYNTDPKEAPSNIGFIAQDVMKQIPEAVHLNEEKDRYGLNTKGIVAALVNAIKELKEEIEELKKAK